VAISCAIFGFDEADLSPLTDLRPACLVRTGALTTLERLTAQLAALGIAEVRTLWVAEELAAVTRDGVGLSVNAPFGGGEDDWLLVNGRCVMLPQEVEGLEPGGALVEAGTGRLLAIRLSAGQAETFAQAGGDVPSGLPVCEVTGASVLHRQWDVIRHRDTALAFDLELLAACNGNHLPSGITAMNPDGIHIAADACVQPGAILDGTGGTIVIDEGALVRPGAIIVGPCYVGRGSTVLERAHVKANTSIGPVCKVNGEVGGTIFQGYSNKAHDGHLGDSYIGEWANLGAGTTNSNLLNTYGEVTCCAAHGRKRERTGLTFLGCIVGDHVKTAIMTRIMTGAVFGTGAMLAQPTPPTAVGAFEWLMDDRRQVYRLGKFLDVARTVMARRGTEMSAAMEERLGAVHARAEKAAAR